MGYVGTAPLSGDYRKLDDISGDFDGSDVTFDLEVGSVAVTPPKETTMLISVGGILQEPVTAYTVSGSVITFTAAPATGADFFGILLGDTMSIGTPSDGTITAAKVEDTLISGQTEITSGLAAADEFLYSDGGTIKRVGLDTLADKLAGTNITATAGVLAAADTNTTYTAGDGLGLSGTEFSTDLVANGGLEIQSTELSVAQGISQYDVAQFAASVVDNDFLRIDGTTVEGLSVSEVAAAIESSIDAVGTIAAGTWEGTTIAVAQGGTGATALTDLITLGTHTTGDYAATITAGTGLTSTGATSGESIAHSLSVDAAQTGITSIINSTLKIQADPGSSAAGDVSYSFQTDTDTGMYLSGTNEISWATAGAQEMLLQADGDLHVEGDVIAFSTTVGSDINLKENVQTLPNALETVNRLRGVSFDWKKKHKGSSIGVIAQEVEKVFPELVDEHALNGMKTVNYSALIGVLIEAVKELSDKVGD